MRENAGSAAHGLTEDPRITVGKLRSRRPPDVELVRRSQTPG